MIESALSLVSVYGALIVAGSAYLSCLLVPIPTSLFMLAAGGFVASGDLDAGSVFASVWLASVAGDQSGYWIGRRGMGALRPRLTRSRARADALARAEALVAQRGGLGVFFSTWLVAPLGPWVNIAAGGTGLSWLRFTLWDAAGEAIWVGGYLTLGRAFASQLDQVSVLLGDLSGLLAAGVVALGAGLWLRRALNRRPRA